jgi:hypothetical protein
MTCSSRRCCCRHRRRSPRISGQCPTGPGCIGELRRPNVTLAPLWEEQRASAPEGSGIPGLVTFIGLGGLAEADDASDLIAGERLFVVFAGRTVDASMASPVRSFRYRFLSPFWAHRSSSTPRRCGARQKTFICMNARPIRGCSAGAVGSPWALLYRSTERSLKSKSPRSGRRTAGSRRSQCPARRRTLLRPRRPPLGRSARQILIVDQRVQRRRQLAHRVK